MEYPELRVEYERDIPEKDKVFHYCLECHRVKPLRAHHCSLCNRCFLRMDHHCPWVGNCVGQNTHKSFFMFLCWGFVLSLISAATLVAPVCYEVTAPTVEAHPTSRFFGLMLCFILMLSFAIATLVMVVFHMRILGRNLTTIEELTYNSEVYLRLVIPIRIIRTRWGAADAISDHLWGRTYGCG